MRGVPPGAGWPLAVAGMRARGARGLPGVTRTALPPAIKAARRRMGRTLPQERALSGRMLQQSLSKVKRAHKENLNWIFFCRV